MTDFSDAHEHSGKQHKTMTMWGTKPHSSTDRLRERIEHSILSPVVFKSCSLFQNVTVVSKYKVQAYKLSSSLRGLKHLAKEKDGFQTSQRAGFKVTASLCHSQKRLILVVFWNRVNLFF